MSESSTPQAASPGTPPPSGCSYDGNGSVACVTLKPELSDVKWDQIDSIGKSVEQRLQNEKPKKVVFDISGLTYMGSAMVALVVRWWKAVENNDGQSNVVCRDPNVLEVLKLASLDEHWTIVPTTEAAYKKLGASAPAGSAGPVSTGGGTTGTDSGEGPGWPGAVAGVGAGVAVIGFLLGFLKVVDNATAVKIAIIAAVVGAILGLVGVILCTGKRRSLAIMFLIFSIAAGGLTAGVLGVDSLGGDGGGAPEVTEEPEPANEPEAATETEEPEAAS